MEKLTYAYFGSDFIGLAVTFSFAGILFFIQILAQYFDESARITTQNIASERERMSSPTGSTGDAGTSPLTRSRANIQSPLTNLLEEPLRATHEALYESPPPPRPVFWPFHHRTQQLRLDEGCSTYLPLPIIPEDDYIVMNPPSITETIV